MIIANLFSLLDKEKRYCLLTESNPSFPKLTNFEDLMTVYAIHTVTKITHNHKFLIINVKERI